MSKIKYRGFVTEVLIALCVIVFVIGGRNANQTSHLLASSYQTTIANGQYYRLLTNLFWHFNMVHLLSCLAALCLIGKQAEDIFGRWKTFALFLVVGVFTSLISVFCNELLCVYSLSAGSSTAVFGLLGACWFHMGKTRQFTKSAAAGLALFLLLLIFLPQADRFAHGFGLIIGGLTAAFVDSDSLRKTKKNHSKPSRC